ncbi:Sucrose PTS repressor, DeoR family [Spiroplasma clarkii]|uniref:hypothetical protein n=1 Tax=Spiroplasma clarkii TaxID=2139 RepID=UPI000B556140|nr:hypothetical protein [Spiroplasma clarkii]ARU91735.1 Sucrose PTS repressor, DeoR family [Spiroplasma clarkii]
MLEDHINEINVDKLFMSCDHYDSDYIYCNDIYESFIIKKMIENAAKKFMLVDYTKVNSRGTIKTCSKDILKQLLQIAFKKLTNGEFYMF